MTPTVRILVVDDEAVTRLMLRRVLLDSGYDVLEATQGEEALARLREGGIDLVLLDVRMPVLNGFDTCRALRRMTHTQHLPVLMLTSLDDVMAVTLAFEAGATDFVTKPINWALLSQRVRYALRTHRTERLLRESQQNLARAQEIARLAPWSKSFDDDDCQCGGEMRALLGVSADGPVPMSEVMARVIDEDRQAFADFFARQRADVGEQQVEVRLRVGDELRHLAWTGSPSLDERGRPVALFGIVQDLTERRNTEARLSYQAHFDPATGLPNEVLLRDRVGTQIGLAQRHGGRFALMQLRTDALRKTHSVGGHAVAARVLRALAERIGGVLQGPDTLSRLDDGRFALLLGSVQREVEAAQVAQRLIDAFAGPLAIDAWELMSTVHIGVAMYPTDGDDIDTLLAHAGSALARAESEPASACHFYLAEMQAHVSDQIATQVALYRGLERGEFTLHFQPLVNVGDGRLTATEALIRWNRPEHGLQPPDRFIPMLEQTGMILDAGDWVLRSAAQALKGLPLRLAVNISPRQLQHPNIANRLVRILEEVGFPPERLEVEITEQAVMADEVHAEAALRDLAARGIRIALDDYGIGFSSLQRLKRLPLDALKIDRFFVTKLLEDSVDAAIVHSTIALCHQLGIEVVAEGVEDEGTLARLREFGCDLAQGFGISPPLSEPAFLDWVRARLPA